MTNVENKLILKIEDLEDKILKNCFKRGGVVEYSTTKNYLEGLKHGYYEKHNFCAYSHEVIAFCSDWITRLYDQIKMKK